MKTSVKLIKIFGAGISGLVAAINLARSGYEVEVFEKRDQIGGSPHWHPSVHQQILDLKKTSEYIGIDLTPCFRSVKKHTFYIYGRKIVLDTPIDSYICEKGPRPSSIENHLYSQAVNIGVRFNFDEAFDFRNVKHMNTETQRCVVATGLEPKPYRDLGIKHAVLMGFRSSQISDQKDIINSYLGDYTNDEFAYVASYGNLMFSLLFARRKVTQNNLEDFQKHLYESDNLIFDKWRSSSGVVPFEINLVKDRIVLAGAISGMIDPFYLNGISSALISGRIAAMFFEDRERAFRDFSYFTRNFHLKRNLKSVADVLPLKTLSFPLVARLNNRLKSVGVM